MRLRLSLLVPFFRLLVLGSRAVHTEDTTTDADAAWWVEGARKQKYDFTRGERVKIE